MFKAQIDWRGVHGYEAKTKDRESVYTMRDVRGNITHCLPAQVTIMAFKPVTQRENSLVGTSRSKNLFGVEREIQNHMAVDVISLEKASVYFSVPLSKSYNTDAVCVPTELKSLVVDVPYEALQHLSVVANMTGAVIDLSKAGQEKISHAFNGKTGVFAPEDTPCVILDVDKNVVENTYAPRIRAPII
jgi:hypothetical protein|tara:strand:- start:267626 stop:268189 length:564 start_codon:yes stop_codon:yes gene_type:complete